MNFKRVCLLFLFNLCIFLDQRKYTLYSHNADDRYVRPAHQSRYQTKIYVFLHSSFRSRDFKVVLIRIVEIN